ncbi:hypothetical protein I316_04461 [Kwoniella heveanensis BCC8398]|uniref:Uncharacterized protein n=1 Tax=Kwoniella heveanensis BCC8398 TaxID=1296120 RepID=A0A1B9GRP8_9TREE|nr:hypothetical protein I316_04461 [Kwoniella heveanensis BCC8398]
MSSPVQDSSPSPSKASTSSSELPYPTFPSSSSKTARLSYATSSPPTPNPADLFFKPPKSSPRTPPVRSPPPPSGLMPEGSNGSAGAIGQKGKVKEPTSSGKKKNRDKSRLSRMMDSPDTADYMARLPSSGSLIPAGSDGNRKGGGHTPGVFVGTGLDARSLADMLSPPGIRSPSSRKKKGKRRHHQDQHKDEDKSRAKDKGKRKAKTAGGDAADNSFFRSRTASAPNHSELLTAASPPATPPPLPPKPTRTTPRSTRTTTTTFTDISITPSRSRSSHTHSTETDFHSTSPQKAVYGQMASASSHQILGKPSLQSLIQAQQVAKYQNVPLKSGGSGTTATGTGTGTLTTGPTTSTSTMTYIPDISESMDHYRRDSFTLEGALAALPWAEPPPRDPTLPLRPDNGGAVYNPARGTGSPALISSTFHSEPGTARTLTYSFLTSDPTVPSASYRSPLSQGQSYEHSRRSSRVPSVPQSPSIGHSQLGEAGPDGRRYSAQSAYSGMADQVPPTQTSTSGFANSNSHSSPLSQQSNGPSQHFHNPSVSTSIGEGMSFGSAMATQGSSYSDVNVPGGQGHSKGKKSWSHWSFGSKSRSDSRLKSPTASNRTRSIRSSKSTRSSKSKRASNSTLAHGQSAGFGGSGKAGGGGAGGWRWEIRRYEELDGDEGDGDENEKEIVRSKEEMMELATLVGRAAVLERMLRSGKRVSSQSVRQLLRSFTPSSHTSPLPPLPTHRPSLSLTVSSPSASFSITSNINGDIKSNRRVSRRSSYSNSIHHSQTNNSPRTPSAGDPSRSHSASRRSSPASIVAVGVSQGLGPASIRERLKRRLERSESREDIFTEIGSSQGHDQDDDSGGGSGVDWVGEEITLLPSSFSQSTQEPGAAHRPRLSGHRHRLDERERKKSVRGEARDISRNRDRGTDIERGEDRIGGKGVIVFPEEIGPFGTGMGTDTTDQPGKAPDSKTRTGPTIPAIARIKGDRRSIMNCTSSNRILGTFDPTLAYGDPVCDTDLLEKGLPGNRQGQGQLSQYDSKGRPYYPQSPHLGHRSPGWRNRQSVLSYISANGWQEDPVYDRESVRRRKWRWKVGLGVGSGLMVILIIGLLVGLLVKRDDGSSMSV